MPTAPAQRSTGTITEYPPPINLCLGSVSRIEARVISCTPIKDANKSFAKFLTSSPFHTFSCAPPPGPSLSIKIYAAADERELYRYVTRSFRTFEEAVFAKACETSATAVGGRSEGAQPPREKEPPPPHRGDPLPSEFAEAFASELHNSILDFERLEETADR